MKALHMIAFVLLAIGGINWGLIGLGQLVGGADWNVVAALADYVGGATVENIIYLLVGLSAVWIVIGHKSACKECANGASM